MLTFYIFFECVFITNIYRSLLTLKIIGGYFKEYLIYRVYLRNMTNLARKEGI